jgi:hypothetical protein
MSQGEEKRAEKIIVDEDWKTRVEAERAAMADPSQGPAEADDYGPLPPPSLELLATTLGMQAMMSLGLVPNPVTGKAETNFEQAKHLIDLLEMLWNKTQGNRTPDETASLDHLLHELRLAYVAVREKMGGTQ